MAQASRQKAPWHMVWRAPLARGTREGMFILITAAALYLLLALSSFSPDDPGWSHTGRATTVLNQGGVVGSPSTEKTFHVSLRSSRVKPSAGNSLT